MKNANNLLIDSHAHLNDEKLLPLAGEIHDTMERDGLRAIINVGYDRESSECAYKLTEYENYFAAVGIHPHDAKTATQGDYERFAELVTRDKVVAIGEIGLDFYYDLSPREVQERVFIEQLDLAHSLKMPVIIHLRDAYGAMLKLLKDNKKLTEYGILLHCYSGSKEILTELAKLGAYFSFGGAITFKNATDKPDVVRATPKDRLLLETDCPYMTPVPYRGKTNEPKYVNLVADKVSEILSVSREEVAETTARNTVEFFGKMKKFISA